MLSLLHNTVVFAIGMCGSPWDSAVISNTLKSVQLLPDLETAVLMFAGFFIHVGFIPDVYSVNNYHCLAFIDFSVSLWKLKYSTVG